MFRNLFFILILIGIPGSASSRAAAAPALVLESGFDRVLAGRHVEVFEDATGLLTIDDILCGENLAKFYHPDRDRLLLGYSSSAFWGKLDIDYRGSEPLLLFFEMTNKVMERIDLYVVEKGSVRDSRRCGSAQSMESDPSMPGSLNFQISFEPKSQKTIFYRIKTGSAHDLTPSVWSKESFMKRSTRHFLLYGMFYGAIIIIIIYNFFHYFTLGEKIYLEFSALYVVFTLLMLFLNGHARYFGWTGSWTLAVISILGFLYLLFTVQFARSFLGPLMNSRVTSRFFIAILALGGISLAAIIPGYHSFLLSFIAFLVGFSSLVITGLSFTSYRRGNTPARYYFLAWIFFWIGTGFIAVNNFLPVGDWDTINYIERAASIIEMSLFSFGLSSRTHYRKKDLDDLSNHFEDQVATRTEELNSAINALTKKENEIRQELDLAGTIQRGILPHMPINRDGVVIDSYYQSMFQIGGDFYDVFRMPGGFLGILIADVSGHGMPAAFITALAKISFSEAIQRYLFPSEIFVHVNNNLTASIKTDDFVTAFFVVISPTREVFYSNASHNMACVFRRSTGSVDQWDTDGLFLGYSHEANERYRDGIDTLAYGDRIILYTDGITEGKNEQGEPYGEERFIGTIIACADLPVSEARDCIINAWKDFRGTAAQDDDATLLVIEIDPAHEEFSRYRDKGFQALNRGDVRAAIQELDKALSMNEYDEQVNLFMGEACLFAGRFRDAAKYLEFYIANNKFDAKVWHHLAEAWFNLSNFDGAIFAARKAVKLKPDFVDSMSIMARSFEATARTADSLVEWKRILEIDPEHQEALKGLRRYS